MMQRSLWGLVYALVVAFLCIGLPWTPALLFLLLLGVAVELIRMPNLNPRQRSAGLLYTFASALATGWLWGVGGGQSILAVFILIWLSDSMAYVGGRLFGRTPMAPVLSPKKTWEGLITGILFTVGTAYGLFHLALDVSLKLTVVLAVVVAATAPIGDLIGSYFKRQSGVKDSGVFLPGHGGFLDRLDSYLLSSITLVLVLLAFQIF
ncbi:MAG: phosphatidate cytidylyltransferase [Schleiferiaceae bacterium]|jgi:CDP-diglyceride synthetase|nr:phosphatidate cytidylyltransferase [Schleiferiaceae bacterium]MDP4833335.1 phosphatidate cytidylyltransferase [Schleiferiaceae bacterium]